MKLKTILALSSSVLLSAWTSQAAITFTGNYSQSFDTLVTAGVNQTWANNSTLQGWSLFNKDAADITAYNAGNGSVNTGSFYSFGTGTASERALGGTASGGAYFGTPATGAIAGYIAVALVSSASAYNGINISYTGEQWRNGGNSTPQTMVLEYGFGSTFGAVSSWALGGAGFNFTSLQNTATAAALDGNAVANKTAGLGGAISTTWNIGDTLWIRWIENNDAGNDHGLAIDDFSITATPIVAPVPEPSTFIAGALLLLPFGARGIRYLRNQKPS